MGLLPLAGRDSVGGNEQNRSSQMFAACADGLTDVLGEAWRSSKRTCSSASSFVLTNPHGNTIRIDQHAPRPEYQNEL